MEPKAVAAEMTGGGGDQGVALQALLLNTVQQQRAARNKETRNLQAVRGWVDCH
jgi:hypothetical protein